METIKLEGFVQISTKIGSFICKKAEMISDGYIKMHGPIIITLQVMEDPKTKQLQKVWNKDTVTERYMRLGTYDTVDVLDPVNLDKGSKEIYTSLSGVQLL